ncbi:MAG: hypothetical protein Q7R87_02550 [Nanoarchaeota archaeon]|nr:hypothetical protein [Nanoarchaeota archaeon]
METKIKYLLIGLVSSLIIFAPMILFGGIFAISFVIVTAGIFFYVGTLDNESVRKKIFWALIILVILFGLYYYIPIPGINA